MPKIQPKGSLEVAYRVLSAIELVIPNEIAEQCQLEVMSNCREQFLSITRYGYIHSSQRVCFGEHRNSDNICVYWGDTTDFDIGTNQPASDEVWDRAKFFSWNEETEAAKWIVEFLGNVKVG